VLPVLRVPRLDVLAADRQYEGRSWCGEDER